MTAGVGDPAADAEDPRRTLGDFVKHAACERWALDDVEGASDEPEWVDVRTTSRTPITRLGSGVAGEVKGAIREFANDGRLRAGRWWIRRSHHDALVDADGFYALGVHHCNGGVREVARIVLVAASTLDQFLAGRWTPCGGNHRAEYAAQLPWPAFLRAGLDPRRETR